MKTDEPGLARLMALAQSGDRQAYSALLTASAAWLRRYFCRRVAPSSLDDLVQETLVALHRKLSSYDPSRPFLPWLAAIARYRWVDHLRLTYRAELTDLDRNLADHGDHEQLAARLSLERLFAHLPAGQARAIELVKIHGLSIAEASNACGQSVPLVKTNIHRGLKRLAMLIEEAE